MPDEARTQLMDAFEDDGEAWQDDRQQQPARRGLLGFMGRTTTRAAPAPATDAVFGNLLAKEDQPQVAHDDESPQGIPPTYEEASNDNAPSYWETTIMASGWCDDVLVDELPVGSNIQLIWNMLLSFAFGIGGFIGTYLVHTTHASKAGSILGLALNLLQADYSTSERHAPSPHDPNEFRPDHPNSYDENSPTGSVNQGAQVDVPSRYDTSSGLNWLTTIFAFFLIYYALLNYVRVYRIKLAVLAQNEGVASAIEAEPSEVEVVEQPRQSV